MTVEEIRERFENDTLNVQFVPYVKPLLEHIDRLAQMVKGLQKEKNDLMSELPYDD